MDRIETGEGSKPVQDLKERFAELAKKRYSLEKLAEERMGALVETLEEIRNLDAEQRKAARAAFLVGSDSEMDPRLVMVLSDWLGDRLSDQVGRVRLVKGISHAKSLSERDPLAKKG